MNDGAARLRVWRLGQGLSQAKACSQLSGMDQSLYSKLERGERKPTRTLAVVLERELGIPVWSWDVPSEAVAEAVE